MMVPFVNDSYSSFKILEDWQMDYVKVGVFFVLSFLIVFKRRKVSKLFVSLLFIEGFWLVSTLINYGFGDKTAIHKTVIDMINALSVAELIEYYRKDPKSLLCGLMLNFELALYPNLYGVITHFVDHGYYLLGYYATLILWTLPATCVGALYISVFKDKPIHIIRGVLLILISMFTVFRTWCATMVMATAGMIGIVVLGMILYWFKPTRNWKIHLSLLLIAIVALNYFVLFVYQGGDYKLIDDFIIKVLGRTTTFTNRTPIWSKAIEMIKEKPWIGHGFRPVVELDNGTSFIHSHNQFLQRLNATGIIGSFFFLVFHIVLTEKVDRIRNSIERTVMVGAVFAVSVTYLMDAYKKFFRFYFVFFLAYHVNDLIGDRRKKKLSE